MFVYQPKPAGPPEPRSYFTLEFALGYSQFSGFGSSDPTIELRGAVRELPSASLYATLTLDSWPHTLRRPLTVIQSPPPSR